MKMRKIRKRMGDICEWRKNYMIQIQGIKNATNGSSRVSHNLEAAEAYPRGLLSDEFESLVREVKLMKALETDIQEMVDLELDGKLKVWMEEMHGVIADLDKFIEEHGEITRDTLIENFLNYDRDLDRCIYFKEKIQHLHERRERYGIESIETSSTNVEGSGVIISWPAESSEMVSDRDRLLLKQLNEPGAAAVATTSSSTVNHEYASPFLWRCLFYFLLFPEGQEIPARRLIAVWIAEGSVGPKIGENKPAEYYCHLCLAELVERRMIQVTRRKHNGKAKAFKLCDTSNMMRETLSKRAEAANFFQDSSNMTSRLAHYGDINTSCYEHINGSKPCSSSVLKSHYKKVISFFSFDTTEGRKHGENIGNFLHRCIANGCFKSMRVLDLERVFKPKLPSALGALTGLRYLGLRWTYLERLPDHVSMLLSLQVLDVKRTYISTLPKSIWSMQLLRHLYLSETYRSRFVRKPTRKSLTDLLTLWGAFIDEDSPVVNGLDTILNLRKLGLTCRSMSSSTEKMKSQLEAVGDWITNLQNLEDLRIKSFDDLDNPSELHLKPFSGHKFLSTIYLVGRLRYPTIVSEFPATITDITLSRSELENDPMVALQNLPNLLVLRLLAASTKRRLLECRRGGFQQLKVLKLWSLENWDEWRLEQGSLPSLIDMEIRSCHKLKIIPREITQLQALEKFTLSDKFEQEIKTNQFRLWNEIKHVLIVDQE